MRYVIYRAPGRVSSSLDLPRSRAGRLAALAVAALRPTAILFGLMMGSAMTRWLVDAAIRRMRDPKVRQRHSEAVGFLY